MAYSILDGLDAKPYSITDDAPAPSSAARRYVADPALSLAKGVIGVGEAAVGLADISTLGRAGKALSDLTGFDPKRAKGMIDEYLTPEQRAANKAVQQADGIFPTLGAIAQNPSVVPHAIIESAPSMFGGGAIARGARMAGGALAAGIGEGSVAAGLARIASRGAAPLRAAIGEGAISGGQTAEQIRQETTDGVLTPGQAFLAAGSGALTGGIARGSAGLAKKLGISDIDVALAGGSTGRAGAKGMLRRGAEGFLTEGALEEMPQSAQEQVAQNLALGKPIGEGVGQAAGMGLVTGGVQGGLTAAALPGRAAPVQQPQPAAAPPETFEQQFERAYGAPPGGLTDAQISEMRQQQALRDLDQGLNPPDKKFDPEGYYEGFPPPPDLPPPGGAVAPPDPLHAPDAGPLARAAGKAVDSGLAPNPYAPPLPEAFVPRAEVTVPPDLQMQNRDRSRPGSVAQMQAIANNPDYDRLGAGRSPNEAAPMVAVGANAPTIPEADFGRLDRVTMGDGSKLPFRYAVVEAPAVLASHNADGSVNGNYFAQVPPGTIRALNNGRIAALQEAYRRGTTEAYRQAMIADAQAHGVAPEAIAAKKNPVLVRVYDDAENARPNMAAISNPQLSLKPSAPETAQNDAVNLDVAGMVPDEAGNIITPDNEPALRKFLASIPASEHNELVSKTGFTKQFSDRVRAAVFAKAYGNAEIVSQAVEDADPETKNVLTAMTRAAPEFAKVDHGAALDVRPAIVEAIGVIRAARARGLSASDLAAHPDLLGRDPMTQRMVDFIGGNARSVNRLAAGFAEAARFLQNEQAAKTSGDLFGRREAGIGDLIARVNSHLENLYGPEAVGIAAEKDSAYGVEQAAPAGSRGDAALDGVGGQPDQQQRAAAAAGPEQEVAPFSYTPGKDLTPEERAVEERFGKDLAADPATIDAKYAALPDAKGGRVLNTDTARELSPDYLKNRTLANAVHEPASAVIKRLYAARLAEAPEAGREPVVLFTAGGTGAGKSTAIDNVPAVSKVEKVAQIVYDSTMDSVKSATAKIQLALDANKEVVIAYVYRDPVEAFVDGALWRAKKMEGDTGSGRTAPIVAHAKTHQGSLATIGELQKIYAGNERVLFHIIDNSRGFGKAASITLDELTPSRYADLEGVLHGKLEEERSAGRISEALYRGFKGQARASADGPGAVQGDLGRDGAGTRGRPEQGRGQGSPPETVAGAGKSEAGPDGLPPKDKPLVLVLGGTYNPVHAMHVQVAKDARAYAESLGYTVRKVLMAPVGQKLADAKAARSGETPTALADRTEMIRRAVGNNSVIEAVSGPGEEADAITTKLRRTQLADWVASRYPGTTTVNVTGDDQAVGHPPAFPSVYQGDPGTAHDGYFYMVLPRDEGGLSSSKIRAAIAKGAPLENGWMAPGAEAYYREIVARRKAPVVRQPTSRPSAMQRPFVELRKKRDDPRAFTKDGVARKIADLVLGPDNLDGQKDGAAHPATRAAGYMLDAIAGNREPRGPVTVEAIGDGKYRVVSGAATVRAARLAGWTKVQTWTKEESQADVAQNVEQSFFLTGSKRKADHNPAQLELFAAADRFVRVEVEKNVDHERDTPKGRTAREAALRALSAAGSVNLLAASINVDMIRDGSASIIGQQVTSTADLAAVAQVYRDPRFETLRYILTKNGKVVHETAVSCRLPSMVTAWAGGFAEFRNGMEKAIKATGADGLYMLHNHPSGNASPSEADLTMTKKIGGGVFNRVFRGHVVIDTNQYTVIDDDGVGKVFDADFGGAEPHKGTTGKAQHFPLLGMQINGARSIAAVGAAIKRPDAVALVGVNSDSTQTGAVVYAGEVSVAVLADPKQRLRLRAAISMATRASGSGSGMFMANVPPEHFDAAKDLVRAGLLRDAVSTEGIGARGTILAGGPSGFNPSAWQSLGRGRMPEPRMMVRGEQKASDYNTADLFGTATEVNAERKAAIKRKAPAIAALPSSQLDLFGNPVDTGNEGGQNESQRPIRGNRPQKPAGEPTGGLFQTGNEQGTGAVPEQPTGTGDLRNDATPSGQPESGNVAGGIGVPVGESGGAGSPVVSGGGRKPRPYKPPVREGLNYRITRPENIGTGGDKQKFRDSVEAIKTLRTIEAEGRKATAAEQEILARYAGWGGLKNAFFTGQAKWMRDEVERNGDRPSYYESSQSPEWRKERRELLALLTDDEYEEARGSTPNAHYTAPQVINAMWSAVDRLGFKAGRILEPAFGIGHFFGLIPDSVGARSTLAAVELDSLSARIGRQLYQTADVQHSGFEAAPLPDNFFDLAISNVPFGDFKVHDPKWNKHKLLIHDYFFAKALDRVRPGGIVAFITSDGTMDKRDATARSVIARQGKFVGAIRLPNDAFKKNAGTEVTTDIIFMQKRAKGDTSQGPAWLEAKDMTTDDGAVRVNEYYHAHPDMMLGKMGKQGSMYGHADAALVSDGRDLSAALAEAIQKLPADVYTEPEKSAAFLPPEAAPEGTKQGALVVKNGRVLQANGGMLLHIEGLDPAKTADMIALRDAVRDHLRIQIAEESAAAYDVSRQRLNAAYDAFVKKHGPLNSEQNAKMVRLDGDGPLLLALEKWDANSGKASKTDIFTERTATGFRPVTSVQTPTEALTVSLNERGRVDLPHMARISGLTEDEVIGGLDGRIYFDPVTREWVEAEAYLSGNVRAKLADAEAAARMDPRFEANAAALRVVLPADIPAHLIDARLGQNWIPIGDLVEFANLITGQLQGDDRIAIEFSPAVGLWKIDSKRARRRTPENTATWGTPRVEAFTLLGHALNGTQPKVWTGPSDARVIDPEATLAAQEKVDQIKTRFDDWWREEPDRATRLARIYNDTANNTRLRQYDGAHLSLPGSNPLVSLRKNVKDGAWRIISGGNTLLAHAVGAGKTWTAIAGSMERKRLSLNRKPLHVVLKSMIDQYPREWLQLYPNANLLVARTEDFTSPEARKQFVARAATGNWDGIVMSHEMFGRVKVSAARQVAYLQERLAMLEESYLEAKAGKKDSKLLKELEKAKLKLEARIKGLLSDESKDDVLTFEELGVDALYVDEAHQFKNLSFETRMTNIAGVNSAESKRAEDLYIKSIYIDEINNGRGGLVFLTGTPISNTMSEMYTMQRYLGRRALEAAGLDRFDNWAAQHGQVVTDWEIRVDGTYAPKARFAQFVNMGELAQMFRTFADVKMPEDLKLPVPEIAGGAARLITAPASPELKAYIEELIERAEDVRARTVARTVDNMLKISTDGRKASLDIRLVVPGAKDRPDSKVNQTVREVHRIWKESAPKRSAQLVFIDFSTPGAKFNIYDDMKKKLVKAGVPANEIAFIQSANTDAKRDQLFEDVRNGRVRIMLGSTQKMGTGVNVQKNLIAAHHLDAPWRPSDIEQRNGRIVRQGNENKVVTITHGITEGSFDAFMWQSLERKAGFIGQALRADPSVRRIEDVDARAMTYGEMKAVATGNPVIIEKMKVDGDLLRLNKLAAQHEEQRLTLARQALEAERRVAGLRDYMEAAKRDETRVIDTRGDKFSMTINGRPYGDRVEAANGLAVAVMRAPSPDAVGSTLTTPIGKIGGFEFSVARTIGFGGGQNSIVMHGENTRTVPLGESADGNLQRTENLAQSYAGEAARTQAEIDALVPQIARAKEQSAIPFARREEMDKLAKRAAEIDKDLGIGHGNATAADAADSDEDDNAAMEAVSEYDAEETVVNAPPASYGAAPPPAPPTPPPLQAALARPTPQPPKDAPEWVKKMAPEMQEALRKSGVWVHKKSLRERVSEMMQDAGLKILQGTLDQFAPVLRRIGEHPYKLLRMASSYDAGLEASLFHGRLKVNSAGALEVQRGTKGLVEILKPLNGEVDRFLSWVAGNRAEGLKAEDRENLFGDTDIGQLKSLNRKLHPSDNFPNGQPGDARALVYARVLRDYNEFAKAILDIAEASDLINAEGRKTWERDFYVPFYREAEGQSPVGNVSGMVNQYAFKRLKGGTGVLNDLLSNSVQNWSHLLQASLKNRAASETLRMAEQLGAAHKAGYNEKGSVYVRKDGKEVHYIVDDPLILDAVASLEAVPFRGPAMRFFGAFKQALTFGATVSPSFRIRNLIRDTVQSLAHGKGTYNPVKVWMEGFKYSSKNNPEYGNILAGGGIFQMGSHLEGNRADYIRRLTEKGIKATSVLDTEAKTKAALSAAWDWWQETGNRAESVNRANRYKEVYDALTKAGVDHDRAHFEAAYAARDIMDFSLHGRFAAIRMLTQMVPFMNARLQGMYKLGRAAHENPARFAAVVGGVALASVALMLSFRGDPDWEEREEWDRDNNWWFKVGDKAFRIPKPFEIGALATVVERATEAALNGMGPADRERFVNRLWPLIASQLAMNPIPQAISPAVQLWANKNAFTGRPIESEHDMKLPVSQRIGPNTSQVGRILGKAGILSPEQIDFTVNAYLAWVGAHALATLDLALRPLMGAPERPSLRTDQLFVAGDFVKDLPSSQSRFVSQFYEHLKKTQQAMGELRNAEQLGQLDRAKELVAEGGADLRLAPTYAKVAREISKINARVRQVQANQGMGADEKRAEIDRLNAIRNRMAQAAERARERTVNRQTGA